jgi:hypothetical protein
VANTNSTARAASVAVTVPRSKLHPDLSDVVVAEVARTARAIAARISGHTHSPTL